MATDLVPTFTAGGTLEAVRPDLPTLAGAWLASLRSSNTRAAYRADLDAWLAFLAGYDLDALAVARPVVDAWRLAMETEPNPRTGRPLAASTVARRLAAVSSFYVYALDAGVVAGNPVERVARPHVPAESQTLGLDLAEASAVLAAARNIGATDYALISLLLGAGLRVSEACGLDVADIDGQRGHTVARVVGKGGKSRAVPLAPFVVEALDAVTAGRTSGPVLTSTPRGATEPEALTRHRAAYLVERAAKAAGVTGISPHSFRHAAATLALDAGAELHRVQDFLGHASPVTTQRYNRARQALDGHAAYALALHLANA